MRFVLSNPENVMEEAFENPVLPSDLPGQPATFIRESDASVRFIQNIAFLGQTRQHLCHTWRSKPETLRYLGGGSWLPFLLQNV